MKRRFTVLLEENAGGSYTATVPLLPGCVTQGSTMKEVLIHAREAIEGFIEVLQRDGEDVPEEEGPFALAAVEVMIADRVATMGEQ